MSLEIHVDISRCGSSAVGAEHGIAPSELKAIAPLVSAAHEVLCQERANGTYGFFDLYRDEAAFGAVKEAADQFLSRGYENLVALGIGGSALGTTALVGALKPPYYNLLSRRARGAFPRIFVMDNIDPATFHRMMRVCPPRKTLYSAVSKSGETAETMTQLMIVLEALEKAVGRDAVKDHLVVTTNPRDAVKVNLLHRVADAYGLRAFVVPFNVGGRFSVFSPVGMFPAAMLGLDLDGLRAGCAAMDARCSTPDLKTNPAYLRAAVQYLADTRKGKVMTVMMPYSDGLRDMADWYRQLWAESLGKRYALDGREVFAGQTPIKALGATDQHSQVQLYREGPNNKIFTIVEVQRFDKTLRIPRVLESISELDYLRGKTMNKLMAAELRATMDALKQSLRPVTRIVLPRIDAQTVGQLMYLFEVETAMAGRLYQVQTFDQPGVDEGKWIARTLMAGKPRPTK